MSAQPTHPAEDEDLGEETFKRIYHEHVDAAEKEPGLVSRQQLLEEGLRKLKSLGVIPFPNQIERPTWHAR
jgi:hypothetical protein